MTFGQLRPKNTQRKKGKEKNVLPKMLLVDTKFSNKTELYFPDYIFC